MNTNVTGANFSCSHVANVKKLGLLDEKGFLRLEKGEFRLPVMATACSDNHWEEAKHMLGILRKYRPKQKVVLYDLGLVEETVKFVKSLCNVEYRKFPFENYPPHVARIGEYRWKPLIIAEMLQEFGAIWYMDSSVVWKKTNLDHVYDLLRCRSDKKVRHERPHWTIPSTATRKERDEREQRQQHESGWHDDRWRLAVSKCDKFAYLLHGYAGHGIWPATHERVFEYFPTEVAELKKPKAKMYEAGFVFAVRTKEVNDLVLKWYVLCALQEDCMGPQGASLGCRFGNDRFADPGQCHRFDQSVVNLLLANANDYDRYYYTSEIVDFFNIVRGSAPLADSALACDRPSS
uniref:Uncharacterized protein n=1 Tax=Plectus sambesii TaxID=2011161 RepID=A0A914UZU0_9BILA